MRILVCEYSEAGWDMAKRRKVANLLALAVLSTIVTQPMHPYEMASVLRERGKDDDMQIKWGSLYTVVRNLEKHGFVRATQSERQGGRPERTVYEITDAGREELTDWVRELVAVPEREPSRFVAGLSVVGVLPPDEVVDLLERRVRALEEQIATGQASYEAASVEVPRLFLVESEYVLAVLRAEIDWVRGLIRDLVDGSMPGIELWRAWHSSGEVPPEWADLAERGSDLD